MGADQVAAAVGFGVAVALPGLVGIIRRHGRIAIVSRWVGLFVLLVPTVYVGLLL